MPIFFHHYFLMNKGAKLTSHNIILPSWKSPTRRLVRRLFCFKVETTINKWRPWEILGISFSLKLDQSEFQKSKGVKMILFHSHFLKVILSCAILNFFWEFDMLFHVASFFFLRSTYLLIFDQSAKPESKFLSNKFNQSEQNQTKWRKNSANISR